MKLNHLPYYIIPERNLLPEKVKETERLSLKQTLSDILKSGPAMLYECETIKQLRYFKPGELPILQHELELFEVLRMSLEYQTTLVMCKSKDLSEHTRLNQMTRANSDLLNCERSTQATHEESMIVTSGWPRRIQKNLDKGDRNNFVELLNKVYLGWPMSE